MKTWKEFQEENTETCYNLIMESNEFPAFSSEKNDKKPTKNRRRNEDRRKKC